MLYFASYIITHVDYEAREADADDLREELAADLEELDAECTRQIESLKAQGNPENFDEFSDEEPLTEEDRRRYHRYRGGDEGREAAPHGRLRGLHEALRA